MVYIPQLQLIYQEQSSSMTSSYLKGRLLPPFFKFIFMKKCLVLILITLLIVSCNQDVDKKGIESSFKQFLKSLEIGDLQQTEKFVPFLTDLNEEEQAIVLEPFRVLSDIGYDLEISKFTDDTYNLRINTKDSNPLWSGISIPYHQNSDGLWVMAPIIESVQFIDIIPAKD